MWRKTEGRRPTIGRARIPGLRPPVLSLYLYLYLCLLFSMKGIVLAGGLGIRMLPLTRITNKHLLPVFDQPMVYYPISKLVRAGITDIMIVTGGNSAGDFLRLLRNGKDFGLPHLHYVYQEGEGGIAEALGLTRDFADADRVVVILGDNIFEDDITPFVKSFAAQSEGAKILLKAVDDPGRFGVAELKGDHVVGIEEKPARPKTNFAVTGIYMYDANVFDIIKACRPSARGEMEITDVNNAYIKQGTMTFDVLRGWWTDAGTFESLHRAAVLVREAKAKVKEKVKVEAEAEAEAKVEGKGKD
jgi:glucose-1-phosphate thymidylyltransferase